MDEYRLSPVSICNLKNHSYFLSTRKSNEPPFPKAQLYQKNRSIANKTLCWFRR